MIETVTELPDLRARQVHQRMVAGMQVAHGRHEPDPQAVAFPGGDAFAQRLEPVDDLDHRYA